MHHRVLACLVVSLALLVSVACAEQESAPEFVPELTLERALATSWDEIEVNVVTGMGPEETGGTAVVFLHGYGSQGMHLVDLASALASDQIRFFLPTAVLHHQNGEGRMWWEFIDSDWPRPWGESADASTSPSQQLSRARTAVDALLSRIHKQYAPERLILAGHSQGAMLALHVATSTETPVDEVVAIAGYVLVDSIPGIQAVGNPKPKVFMSHGREDPIVPFGRAERMREVLEANGFEVEFHVHGGGHEVDSAAIDEFRERLRTGLANGG